MRQFTLLPGKLRLEQLLAFYDAPPRNLNLDAQAKQAIIASRKIVEQKLSEKKIVYGINTGFGKLASKVIPESSLLALQKNLILSHAVGVGPLLPDNLVRILYILKINCLAQGYSGVRYELIEKLIHMYNAGVLPQVPIKGSVGASGDLAPLAHFCLPLINDGFELLPKEGLSMINGLQMSTTMAIEGIKLTDNLFHAALCAGALSMVGTNGNRNAFHERLIQLLHCQSTLNVAHILYVLIGKDYASPRRQDPYSLRCQPQIMGPCLDQLLHVKKIISSAINAVSDNPIVLKDDNEIVSGGNFHGQNIALACDILALIITTIGNLSERRIAFLMDPNFSYLPAFLINESGVNSGLMMLQVTAAALTSENKSLAHPASSDTIPTSNNQEDHVSMSAFSAHRLIAMVDNAMTTVAIELIAACQAIDLQKNKPLSSSLQLDYDRIRETVAFCDKDRIFSEEIVAIKNQIKKGLFLKNELKNK